jgi:leader peptidase (prepilin peptidase)/N-methyltransferase
LVPDAFWGVLVFVFGTVIGSFLNVVIWRLPRGESLVYPGSHCPHCNRDLRAWENIPLFSFLALRARCRTCKQSISWRYFCVELLTAGLFLALFLHFGPTAEAVAYCLFAAALIAAFFIDWTLFIIPDELNTFALLVGFGLNVWYIARPDTQPHGLYGWPPLIGGWLPRSLPGAMICAALFVFIQMLGLALFHKDAMGEGDVKLARAIGALMPLRLALVSFFLAIGVGAVYGLGKLIWLSLRGSEEARGRESQVEETETHDSDVTPFGELVRYGGMYVLFGDLLLQLIHFLRTPAAQRAREREEQRQEEEEEEFIVTPMHLAFGPFMVIGVFLAVFAGDALIRWYLRWTGLAG